MGMGMGIFIGVHGCIYEYIEAPLNLMDIPHTVYGT